MLARISEVLGHVIDQADVRARRAVLGIQLYRFEILLRGRKQLTELLQHDRVVKMSGKIFRINLDRLFRLDGRVAVAPLVTQDSNQLQVQHDERLGRECDRLAIRSLGFGVTLTQ